MYTPPAFREERPERLRELIRVRFPPIALVPHVRSSAVTWRPMPTLSGQYGGPLRPLPLQLLDRLRRRAGAGADDLRAGNGDGRQGQPDDLLAGDRKVAAALV